MRLTPYQAGKEDLSSDKQLKLAIKNIFGFKPGNIFLYRLAFLHKSATQESINGGRVNNERLEFLGDAILDAVTADYLFKTFPTRDEGFLTEMRSKLVSRAQLNKLAQRMGIEHLIQLDGSSNGQFRSFRGDAFEALIGALYLDKGYDFTYKIILNCIIRRYFDMDELVNQEVNFKSKMIEHAQRTKKTLQFRITGETGSGYRKLYQVAVTLDGEEIATGQDHSIKGAEQNAAEKGWQKINEEKG